MTATGPDSYVFFLGGHDLEMETIADLLKRAGAIFHDQALGWGAKASAYSQEIEAVLAQGKVPVLVELEDDLGLDGTAVKVDHHGDRAGEETPTSLHQVFELLRLPREQWSRWYDLVAANDRGYVPAMLAMGATREQLVEVRARDRSAQGITAAEEEAVEQAVSGLESRLGGRLSVVRLPHSRTAPLTDRLEPALGGPGYENLLVVSPDEINFFGDGLLIRELQERFPDASWHGGSLKLDETGRIVGGRGFWGCRGGSLAGAILQLLEEAISSSA